MPKQSTVSIRTPEPPRTNPPITHGIPPRMPQIPPLDAWFLRLLSSCPQHCATRITIITHKPCTPPAAHPPSPAPRCAVGEAGAAVPHVTQSQTSMPDEGVLEALKHGSTFPFRHHEPAMMASRSSRNRPSSHHLCPQTGMPGGLAVSWFLVHKTLRYWQMPASTGWEDKTDGDPTYLGHVPQCDRP